MKGCFVVINYEEMKERLSTWCKLGVRH